MTRSTINGTDLSVSRLCLGLSNLGVSGDESEGKRLLDRFVELGGNFVDTARVYSDWVAGETGRSERILGDWLREGGLRRNVVIATKGGHPRLSSMQRSRLSRRELDEDLSRSLEALGTDVVDLFYLHRDDPEVPVAEVVDILDEFVEAGRVRFVGCSNWRPKRIGEAVEYARSQSKSPFVANQMLWNIGSRHMLEPADRTMVVFDDEARSLHETTGMAAIPYSSQANGFFTKLDRDRREGPSQRLAGGAPDSGIEGSPYNTASNRALYEVVRSVADRSNLPASAVVLRYLLQQPIPTFPVVGCRTQAQLEDSMAAVACHIPEELFREVVRAVEASR